MDGIDGGEVEKSRLMLMVVNGRSKRRRGEAKKENSPHEHVRSRSTLASLGARVIG